MVRSNGWLLNTHDDLLIQAPGSTSNNILPTITSHVVVTSHTKATPFTNHITLALSIDPNVLRDQNIQYE